MLERLLDIHEAARVLGVRESTLYTWAYRGKIPSQKVGRLLKFSEKKLQEWLASQERGVKG